MRFRLKSTLYLTIPDLWRANGGHAMQLSSSGGKV